MARFTQVPLYPGDEVIARLSQYHVNTAMGIIYNPAGKLVGNKDNSGYMRLSITRDGKQISVRRCHIIFWAYYGNWPKKELDHKDRNKCNDRIDNLKEVTHQINMSNRTPRDLPAGVHFKPRMKTNPYQAVAFGKSLGFFPSTELAAQAYQRSLQGE